MPQSEQFGLDNIAVIVPAAALSNTVFGLANCGWLSRLNASMRISVVNRPILVFLISEASMLNEPGPRTMPRPASPYVPVSVGRPDEARRVGPAVDGRVVQPAVADPVRPVAGAGGLHALSLRDRQRQATAQIQDAAELPPAESFSRAHGSS